MSFKPQLVTFGEWLPDQAALGNALTSVKNAIPQAQSYSSVPGLEAISDAASSAVFAGSWGVSSSGTYAFFLGDAAKLYRLTNGALEDVSKAGGYSTENWEILWWGDRVLAVGPGETVQYYDIASSTDFADLPNAPTADCGAVIGDFIVLGGASADPTLLKWSGFNNSELWTPSPATQSDEQALFGKGNVIKRVVPQGNSGVIFCDRSIRIISYVGPPLVFRIDVAEEDKGVLATNAVCWVGTKIFYYGTDGFQLFEGGRSTPIGLEKVDRFVRADLDASRITEMRAAIDRKYQMAVFTYPSLTTGEFRQLCYRWELGRWGMIDANLEAVFDYASGPVTVEGLDTLYADIDTMGSVSIDSAALAGGTVSLGGVRASDHKVVTLTNTGTPLAAELETGEFGGLPGRVVNVKSMRPLIDASCTLQIATREAQTENYEYGDVLTANDIGEMDAPDGSTSSRYHRFKISVSAQFQHAQGVEALYRDGGRR